MIAPGCTAANAQQYMLHVVNKFYATLASSARGSHALVGRGAIIISVTDSDVASMHMPENAVKYLTRLSCIDERGNSVDMLREMSNEQFNIETYNPETAFLVVLNVRDASTSASILQLPLVLSIAAG